MKLNICPTSREFDKIFQGFQQLEYSRPCIFDVYEPKGSDVWYRYLKDEIHFWLKDHNIEYDLKYNKPKGKDYSCEWIEIHMLKKEHLMFFKLTWL